MHGVLGHFKSGSSHSAGIDGLSRGEHYLGLLECSYGLRRTSHIGDLRAAPCAVLDKLLRICPGHFILECTRHGDVALDAPGFLARVECGGRELLRKRGHHIVV